MVHITYTGCHHEVLLEHIFQDRMAMDLFSEIHTKSRSTQAYRVDAFWVVTWYNTPLHSCIQKPSYLSLLSLTTLLFYTPASRNPHTFHSYPWQPYSSALLHPETLIPFTPIPDNPTPLHSCIQKPSCLSLLSLTIPYFTLLSLSTLLLYTPASWCHHNFTPILDNHTLLQPYLTTIHSYNPAPWYLSLLSQDS